MTDDILDRLDTEWQLCAEGGCCKTADYITWCVKCDTSYIFCWEHRARALVDGFIIFEPCQHCILYSALSIGIVNA